MGDGLFFWLIIVAVAVLQGIGQKKRKPGKPGQRQPDSRPQGQQAETSTRPGQTRPGTGEPGLANDEGASSEAMIPSEIWEEILGLARGTPPKRRRAQGAPEGEVEEVVSLESEEGVPRERDRMPPKKLESRWASPPSAASLPDYAPAARKFPASHGADAVLHGSKPSGSESRLGVPRQSAILGSEGRGKSVRAELFGGGTLRELRKAIVHQEVLGKPVSLKDDR